MRIAKIRTSDRGSFKRCRRKWDISSGLRQNRAEGEARAPLWLGSGFHYAMEDFHGYNIHGHPVKAWEAYVAAVKAAYQGERLPDTWVEDDLLAKGMIEYYLDWLKGREPLKTFEFEGRKQVEVKFEIPIPLDPAYVKECGYDGVVYQGTLDRVIVDEHGRLWVLDYKTAKQFSLDHLTTDPQITSYLWAGTVLYNQPITGFIYQQHKKGIPDYPTVLKNGNFSVAKAQNTTHRMYKSALIDKYGAVEKAPMDNVIFLNHLASEESPEADIMIRRDYEYRNEHQIAAEGAKILQEAADMINPKSGIYPNPTRDCGWDCGFKDVCLMMDDGSDFKSVLESTSISREDSDLWRNHVSIAA